MPPRPGPYADTYVDVPGMGIHALGPNAVVVLDADVWEPEQAAALTDAIVRTDVLVVALPKAEGLAVLDEAMMREHGWVRAEGTS